MGRQVIWPLFLLVLFSMFFAASSVKYSSSSSSSSSSLGCLIPDISRTVDYPIQNWPRQIYRPCALQPSTNYEVKVSFLGSSPISFAVSLARLRQDNNNNDDDNNDNNIEYLLDHHDPTHHRRLLDAEKVMFGTDMNCQIIGFEELVQVTDEIIREKISGDSCNSNSGSNIAVIIQPSSTHLSLTSSDHRSSHFVKYTIILESLVGPSPGVPRDVLLLVVLVIICSLILYQLVLPVWDKFFLLNPRND